MATRLVSTEARLAELGHELPPASTPKGSYVTVTRSGNLLFTGAAIFSHLQVEHKGRHQALLCRPVVLDRRDSTVGGACRPFRTMLSTGQGKRSLFCRANGPHPSEFYSISARICHHPPNPTCPTNPPSMSSPFLHRRYASSVLPHLPVVHTRMALCVPFPHTHTLAFQPATFPSHPTAS